MDEGYDVVSGYKQTRHDPWHKVFPSRVFNAVVSRVTGVPLHDHNCGFKAYRVPAIARLTLSEPGYAFPMQFWVQAVASGLRIREIPVKLIYNDLNRTFGGPLNDADIRRAHYRRVLHCELRRCKDRLPESATADVGCHKA